jgi:hypothetical protein
MSISLSNDGINRLLMLGRQRQTIQKAIGRKLASLKCEVESMAQNGV